MALKAHLEPGPDNFDRRRAQRRSLRLDTTGAVSDGVEANVTIHNLSAAGLLIETEMPLDIGDLLAIDLPEIGPVGAEIVWRSERLHGCAFQQSLGEAGLAAVRLRSDPLDENEAQGVKTVGKGRLATSLGERIKLIRRERGLTLAQVADELDVSKPTVWAWEKGKARPLPERMEAIAAALGVSVSALREDDDGSRSAVVEECRVRIATNYGTDASKVRIMIEV